MATTAPQTSQSGEQKKPQRRPHRGDPGRRDRGRVPRRAARDQLGAHRRALPDLGRGAAGRSRSRHEGDDAARLEVQQHLGDDRVRCGGHGLHGRPGARDGGRRHRRPDHRAGGRRARSGASSTCSASRSTWPATMRGTRSAGRSTARLPTVENLTPTTEMFETGIKVIDLLAPYARGRQGRPVRRRRRGQDGAHPGAHPQPRPGARRPVGLLRRGRALARGQRPVAGDEGVGRRSRRRCSSSAR